MGLAGWEIWAGEGKENLATLLGGGGWTRLTQVA